MSDLKLNWEENGGLLSENVASWESTFNTQTDECAARDNDVTDTTNA